MSKVVLYYFDGRGRGEAIRWMLAANNIEFDEVFLKTRAQYLDLIEKGLFLYEQVPMLEIDGMKLCQCNAIVRYLAQKGGMCGSNGKQQAMIDMYSDGVGDMISPLLAIAFQPKDAQENFYQNAKKKLFHRYFPVFEKALTESSTTYLADTEKHNMADVMLIMGLSMYIEREETILDDFSTLKNWWETQKKVPWVEKFLAPGSKRKPPPDDVYVRTVKEVLAW